MAHDIEGCESAHHEDTRGGLEDRGVFVELLNIKEDETDYEGGEQHYFRLVVIVVVAVAGGEVFQYI